MVKEDNKKILWITGLKGIAAFIVFIHHFFLFFYPSFCSGASESLKTSNGIELLIAKTPFNIFGWGGSFAVSLFYLISGFLIAYSFFVINKKEQKKISILKRYFSLAFPIFFSSVIIFLILKSGVFRTEGLIQAYSNSGFNTYFKEFNMNFWNIVKDSFLGIFSTGSAPINPPLWTMKNELFYSLLTMVILFVFGKDKKRYFVYAFLAVLNINSYFLCFVLGVILCDTYYNKSIIFEKLNRLDLKIIILLFGIYFSSFTYIGAYNKFYSLLSIDTGWIDKNVLFHTIGAFLIMLFILLSNFSKKILSKKIFVEIGNLSLNIYLFHWVIINTISMFITYKLLSYTKYYLSVVISLLITSLLVYIISKYFEKYFKNGTKFLTDKIVKKIS